tara:strand:+ start:281 stop:511 length:231 start_codon:yes stop_codon:yes gene_type:complete
MRDRDKEAEQDYWDNHPKEKKDELNRTMTEPKTYKEFIRWLEVYSPVDWEEMQRFEDEAGASAWIRFDLEKEDDDD